MQLGDSAPLEDMYSRFQNHLTLWSVAASFFTSKQEWLECPFEDIDPERVSSVMKVCLFCVDRIHVDDLYSPRSHSAGAAMY